MRIFVHLLNLQQPLPSHLTNITALQKEQQDSHPIVILQSPTLITIDQLISAVCDPLGLSAENVIVRMVLVGKLQQKRLRLVKGMTLSDYYNIMGSGNSSMFNYQIELEVDILKQLSTINTLIAKQNTTTMSSSERDCAELFKYSQQLFLCLHYDDFQQFRDTLLMFQQVGSGTRLRQLLNLYNPENGYPLIMLAIFYNKNQFLEKMIKEYGNFLNLNFKSVDGWLPFQLALQTGNKKAVEIMIGSATNLDLNFSSSRGQILYNLIDTINIELIEKTIRRSPIRFEDLHAPTAMNSYQYIWSHKRLVQNQKKQLLQLMHQRHFEMYDEFVYDQLLYNSCQKCIPSTPRSFSPKKTTIYNPNLKILSGQMLRCRNPPLFSKFVFLSVNSYIGAIEQYEINPKLKLLTDRQKLEQYQKAIHLSLQQIQSVSVLTQKQKSWYMKKEWFCFIVRERRDVKHIYACTHQYSANQWVEEIKQAVDAWNKNQHKNQISAHSKKYIHISDAEIKIHTEKKMPTGTPFIELFSKRLSLCEPNQTKPSNSTEPEADTPVVKSKSHYNTVNCHSLTEQVHTVGLQYRDFKLLQLLGEGSFGQVFLVQCLKNGKYYALKTFQKKKIILSKQTKFVIAEVNILKQISHPFIITLFFTFQTPNYIYLGLEYCRGKDLAKHINQELTFPQEDVKFYAAQIVLALQYLHCIGIIYRDLKPENIMLGRDGHVLLVDFGLSKQTENNFAKTFCGSPAYLSPEMLDKKGVGPQTDFFSLGVVIFELIFGQPPFYSQNIHILYQNIQNGILTFPQKISPTTKQFLQALLQKQPKNRLGSKSINDIKNHVYFVGFDWQKLMKKDILAPKRVLLQDLSDIDSEQQLIGMFHNDFDYCEQNYRINRFRNFSFVREEEFL